MAKQATKQHVEPTVQEALSKSEQFLSTYKNQIFYALGGIVLFFGIAFAYKKLYTEPKKEEAMGQMFLAEQAFRDDAFALALNGDGNILGFAQVLSEYGRHAGKAIHLYKGICHLQLGEFEEAIKALSKYKSKDFITQARAYCCIGDAYVGVHNLKKALEYYMKAARHHDNLMAAVYLKKAAIIHEETGAPQQAIKLYEEIKEKYPQTLEAYEADKYIARLQIAQ
ncbi:MAG: tetratricopeptide repeat protein [Bacteroidales bacterium]|nr:tetratricopeptide repeat protein [Bacteroidales bacterium]MCL2738043.1 tetratricopeptide repeat protein [Bacteroidales bacterium]